MMACKKCGKADPEYLYSVAHKSGRTKTDVACHDCLFGELSVFFAPETLNTIQALIVFSRLPEPGPGPTLSDIKTSMEGMVGA